MTYKIFGVAKQCRLLGTIAAVAVVASSPVWAQQVLAPTNFGSQAIGGASGSQTLTFTGLPSVGGVTESSGLEFTAVPTCGASSCTVSVTFTPKYPGLRQDAILVTNSVGQVVGVGPVYGIGIGPQIATEPGLISTFVNRSASALSSANINGVVMGPGGRVYISDIATNSVYYVDPTSGAVTRYAGNGTAGNSGDGGVATSAELNRPSALAFDASANLYIADTGNNVIREVIAATHVITTVAGNGTVGFSGDGGAATSAQLDQPWGIAVDPQANVYIADTLNNRVRKVTAVNGQITASSTISTVAGNGTGGFSGDGGAATSAALHAPWGIALDATGNLFIADSNNHAIREVSGGNISTVAGTGGSAGYSGDGGASTSALLNNPEGIAVDAGGSLYIGDTHNNVVRRVSGDVSHSISTVAGTGTVAGYTGDGGSATGAELNGPAYLVVDATGNVFVVDSGNFAVREITATAAPLSFSNAGPLVITVSNTGTQALNLSGISVSGSNFSQAGGGSCSSSTSLPPGASCAIYISFSPPGSGTAPAGSLVVTSNSLNQSNVQSSISLNQSLGLHFIPMTPCRVVDTRNSDGFSNGFLPGNTQRDYIIPNTPNCQNIPSNALAYSFNVTVVPRTHVLSFLTLWQRGQTRPVVSILNSGDGRIKANAAIVPADTSGGISVFSTDDTELVLDIDGYFVSSAASNYTSGLVYSPITPCRVVDTRNPNGSFGGPSISGQSSRSFPISSSSCTVNVANAQSYVLNVTAIPKSGTLTYLTAWPSNATQPTASVLNAPTGTVMANAAIIPSGNGSVSVYVSDPADVVIDISGYFAPPASGGLSLYTVTPCRALDTRTGTGAFVGIITPNIAASSCAPPAVAQAYVFNATVVPQAPLAYLTLWQAGTTQPLQSTLNADDATIMSNLAFVLTTNGSVAAYASNSTNLILDIFGYWAP